MRPHPGRGHTPASLVAGVVGNVMEWYDFALYGYFASVLSHLFFPGEDPVVGLIATYAVFAGGFVTRPLGALLFGYVGDRISRRQALFLSVLMMAVPTFSLGLLPTHTQVGIAAPLLLIVIRLVQGLSVGGEFSGSVTYVVETAPGDRRGLAGSWANVGSMAGMLLGAGAATAVTTLLTADAVDSWGWRVPFLFGGVIGVFALILRRSLSPSHLFEQHEASHANRSPIGEALTSNFKETVQAVIFTAGYGVLFYIPIVYLPTYVSQFSGHSLEHALQANTVSTVVLLVLIPLMGLASDYMLRRKYLLVLSFLVAVVSSVGLLHLAVTENFTGVLASQLIFSVMIAVPLGIAPATLVELFPTEDRLTGYSLAYNIGLGVVGGTTPMVATWLISITGNILSPAFYLMGAALVAALALSTMRDRSREPLR